MSPEDESRPTAERSIAHSAGTPNSGITFPVVGVVQRDFTCVRCGYNLRGLPAGTRCPECGTPMGESIGNRLLFADSKWLSAVAKGLLATFLLGIALLILPGMFFLAFWHNPSLYALSRAVFVLAIVAGVFAATRPEPFGTQARQRRQWARRAVVLVLAWAVCTTAHYALLPLFGADPGLRAASSALQALIWGGLVLGAVANVAWGVFLAALLFHLATLAARLPRGRLRTFSRSCAWLSLVLGALEIPAGSTGVLVGLMTPVAWVLLLVYRSSLLRVARQHVSYEELFRPAPAAAGKPAS